MAKQIDKKILEELESIKKVNKDLKKEVGELKETINDVRNNTRGSKQKVGCGIPYCTDPYCGTYPFRNDE